MLLCTSVAFLHDQWHIYNKNCFNLENTPNYLSKHNQIRSLRNINSAKYVVRRVEVLLIKDFENI